MSANNNLTHVTAYGLGNGAELTVGTSALTAVTSIDGTDGTGENLILKGVATFDMSGINFGGNFDTIKATSTEAQTIIAKGANKIDLGAAGAIGTVSYTNTNQFGDTISNFEVGAGKDVLNFAGVAATGTGYSEITAAAAINSSTDGIVVADYDIADASNAMTVGQLYTDLVSANTNLGAGQVFYALVTTDATNAANAFVYQATVNGTSDGFANATLVGTLTSISDVTSFDTSNFTMS